MDLHFTECIVLYLHFNVNYNSMKIFEFKADETDWVFAADLEDAKEFYLNHSGCGDLDGYKITETPKSEWKNCNILDVNEIEPDEDEDYNEGDYSCGYKIEQTFEEYAKENTIRDIIATTAF